MTTTDCDRRLRRAGFIRDDDGRYVEAEWNDRAGQYESSDCASHGMGNAYRYSVSRTLAGLRRLGVKSYSRARALALSLTESEH